MTYLVSEAALAARRRLWVDGLGVGEGPFPAVPLSRAALTLSTQRDGFVRRVLMGACGALTRHGSRQPSCGGGTRDTGKACMREGLVRGREACEVGDEW